MRHITATVDLNGKVEVTTQLIGYSGEHNAVSLEVGFTEEGLSLYSKADYFRIVIDGFYSEKLFLSQNNVVQCNLPQDVMKPPKINCQLLGYKGDESEINLILKSGVFSFQVDCSEVPFQDVDDGTDCFEEALHICTAAAERASNSCEIAEKSAKCASNSADLAIANSIEASVQASAAAIHAQRAERAAESLVNNNLANSLKGNKISRVVLLNDVSPIEHTVKVQFSNADESNTLSVKTQGKNLFDKSKCLIDGIKNETAISVRATSIINCTDLVQNLKPNVEYTLSYQIECLSVPENATIYEKASGLSVRVKGVGNVFSPNYVILKVGDILNYNKTFTLTEEQYSDDNLEMLVYCNIYTDNTSGAYVTPTIIIRNIQIEEGATATEYEQFVEPKTYTANADGTLTVPSIYPTMMISAESNTKSLLTGNVLSKPSDWFNSSDGITMPGYDEVYLSSNNYYHPLILQGSYLEAGKEYIFSVDVINFTLNSKIPEKYNSYAVCLQYIDSNGVKYESDKIKLDARGRRQLTFTPTVSGKYNLICFGRDDTCGSVMFVRPQVALSGAKIECEYNRDLNKAFAELQQAIISLGGNV